MWDPGIPTAGEILFLLVGVAVGYLARAFLHDDGRTDKPRANDSTKGEM